MENTKMYTMESWFRDLFPIPLGALEKSVGIERIHYSDEYNEVRFHVADSDISPDILLVRLPNGNIQLQGYRRGGLVRYSENISPENFVEVFERMTGVIID